MQLNRMSGAYATGSVITLGDLLGRPVIPPWSRAEVAPTLRTGIPAAALLLREGYGTFLRDATGPRHYRPLERGSTSPRMRLASATGAVLAVGSLAGVTAIGGHVAPDPAVVAVREMVNAMTPSAPTQSILAEGGGTS
ncbi:MAG: hypothetical protein QOC75_3302, partial [Pseudonocardiales bacterium]|nr:hypothetical protein [Pseudonocardiales bacterium]